jgi:hypothetical protein
VGIKDQVTNFEVDVYYEQLLSIRERDPEAFRRLSGATQKELLTYESAKRTAQKRTDEDE